MASVSPHSTQPGARLGGYQLVRWLGEGGFAEVWLAREVDADPPRSVAVKVMRRGRARDARQKTMFLDEAHLAARIRHPNVARVFEVGDDDGFLFIAMEYVSGGSLDGLVHAARALGEPVPPGVALRLIADACAGLHAAHELAIDGRAQHVIHRDVSPQNILITEDGVPKIIDFGIAKARERIARETSTGIAKGKISYMSPEQARGAEIDRRADVWAIAAVAYELLEGRRVVEGPNEVARLQVLVNEPVSPAFVHTPPAAARVLGRALAFDPRDRHATADDLKRDLEGAIEASGLVTARADVEAYCRRAREAAGEERAGVRLGDLLGEASTEPTASLIHGVTAPPRAGAGAPRDRRRGRLLAGGLVVAVVAGALVARRASSESAAPAPSRADSVAEIPPGARPSATSASSATPSAPSATPVADAATPIAASAPPSAPRRPPSRVEHAAPPAPKPAPAPASTITRPSDDDQIE